MAWIGNDSHIHELWWDAYGWHDCDVTAAAASPTANAWRLGSITIDALDIRHILFLDDHSRLHDLYKDVSGWHDNDLASSTASLCRTVKPWKLGGDSFDPHGTRHIVFLGEDSHIHELSKDASGWHCSDLTVAASGMYPAVHANEVVDDVLDRHGARHIAYLGSDAHVHDLYEDASRWHDEDLNKLARGMYPVTQAVQLAGDAFDPQGSQHIAYLGNDVHIHELYKDAGGWHDADLTQLASGMYPAVRPWKLCSGIFDAGGRRHVVYAGDDGHIHELYNDPGGWHDADLTAAAAGVSPAFRVRAPATDMFDPQGTRHIVFLGDDDHIHELWWN